MSWTRRFNYHQWGLGPTSDDKTRDGVAQAVRKPLVHHEDVWQIIKGQLERLKITPDKNNARQALFPQTATVLDNPTGTAPGFFFLLMTAPLLFCLVPLPSACPFRRLFTAK